MCETKWISETDEVIVINDCGDPSHASSVNHSAANDRPK